MRLIDADSFLANMDKGIQGTARKYLKFYQRAVNDEPTAYDMDNVVDRVNRIFKHHRATKTVQRLVFETIAAGMNNPEEQGKLPKEWIPSEEPPASGKYVLLSFENFSNPLVGRYEEDEDGGGTYYVGDDEESCISQDIIVNAWMPLPKLYKN